MNRRTYNEDDRALESEVKKSTCVSSYVDNIYDAITTGNLNAVKGVVPDYAPPTAKQYRRGSGGGGGMSHETGGVSMDMESLFQSSAEALGEQGVSQAMSDVLPGRADGKSTFAGANAAQKNGQAPPRPGAVVTENQFKALRNYPQIVEFLGTSRGTKIANNILSEINTMIAEEIGKNSALINDHAISCIAQKQFLHQFFQGEGWVCKVTASGPFRGTEAFFFKEDEDKSFILRRNGGKYTDVSADFNVIHDYRLAEVAPNES